MCYNVVIIQLSFSYKVQVPTSMQITDLGHKNLKDYLTIPCTIILEYRNLHRAFLWVTKVVVDRFDHENYWACFNTNRQKCNTNFWGSAALGLSKFRSCALLSMKYSTQDTQQVSVFCKWMTNHFRRTYRIVGNFQWCNFSHKWLTGL